MLFKKLKKYSMGKNADYLSVNRHNKYSRKYITI